MVKSKSTTASSVAAIFLAACTSDVVVHQVAGASYDLQVHTCAEITKRATFRINGGVGAKFCTADLECVTSLLAAPLAAGASQADTFEADSDYTFTVALGSGVSTMELSITSDDGWCIDQLSLGPTGGVLEQLEATPVFLDNPCEVDETVYEAVACAESLQYDIAPAVSSTTADLYSLTTTTCAQIFSSSTAIPTLLACHSDADCYEVLLYELYAEEAPGRVVNGELDDGEAVEWRFWLDAPPTELRLSMFGQLGDADDAWCFSEITFESPIGGTASAVSTTDSWLDAPCLSDITYDGGCALEYVFDLTGGAAAASTPAPSTSAAEAIITAAPTTITATDAEEPSPAPSASPREVVDSMDQTPSPTTAAEVEITPAPATTTTDTEGSPAPITASPAAADSAETVPAPPTGDTVDDVTDQDTSSAAGRYAPAIFTAWMASLFIAAVTMFG